MHVDGVVLAVPATEAAVLLAPLAPTAAGILSTVQYASVAVITMSLAPGSIRAPRRGTGFLVPRTSTVDGLPALITGCTYLDVKWPHLADPDDELVRVSVGRFGDDRHLALDDDQLSASVFGELARMLDIRGAPARHAGHPVGPGFPPVPAGPPDQSGAGRRGSWRPSAVWPWPERHCGGWASPPASAAAGPRHASYWIPSGTPAFRLSGGGIGRSGAGCRGPPDRTVTAGR